MNRLAATFFLLVTAASGAAAPPAHATFPDAGVLRAVVESDHLGQFWGAVLVTHDGETVMGEGFGFANEDLTPIDGKTLFDLASVSKQFTAAAILTLRDDGKLSLDDTVDRFFPDAGGASDKITLRQLLGHTSGLDDRKALQRLDFPNRDEAVRLAMRSEPASEPGATMNYSNAGYVVLAAIIEVASGEPFESYVREHVFAPAGMSNTGFIDGEGVDPAHFSVRERRGRYGAYERVALTDDGWGWGLRGTSGVVTCLKDLAAWDRALRDGRLLSPQSTHDMFTPGNGGYAMGWYVKRTPRATRRAFHSGATRGYRAEIVRLLDENTCIVVLTNERWDPRKIADAIEEALYPTEPERVDATMRLGGVSLSTWGLATLEGAGVRLERPEGGAGGVREIILTSAGKECARIILNEPAAGRLGAELADMIEHASIDNDTTKLMLATRPYTIGDDDTLDLPDGMAFRLMPRYTARMPDGTRVIDERPTIVVSDDAKRFWPVIVLLGRTDAERLAHDLAGGSGGSAPGRSGAAPGAKGR